MLNEREDKYDGDDTEYHFSDEEVNYDAESSDELKPESGESSGFSGILQKKRLLISVGVFIVLLSVVYKVISPTNTATPNVNISDMKPADVQPTLAVQAPPAQSVPPIQHVEPVQPVQQVAQVPPPAPAPVQAMPAQAAPEPTASEQASQDALAQAYGLNTNEQAPAPVAPQAVAASPEPVAPVDVTVPPAPVAATPEPINVPGSDAIDSKVVTLAEQNQKLMERLQEQYDQRIKDYQTQNQNLQQEVQTLNTRVAGMENQLTQVIKGASKSQVKEATPTDDKAVPPPGDSSKYESAPRIQYNVQAIIPGRAWLKSDNGETITVAEGDIIKGVGRVTRIDPYDGVVEINLGKRTVALSYGTTG